MQFRSEVIDPDWPSGKRPTIRVRFVLTREEAIDAAVRRAVPTVVDVIRRGARPLWVSEMDISVVRGEFRKIMAGQGEPPKPGTVTWIDHP